MSGPKAPRDKIFSQPKGRVDDFNFGRETAVVFDDMLDRSVPFYGEQQRMIAELAADFATDGGVIYDLGCSTGTSFLAIDSFLPPEVEARFVGIDSSPEMLELAERKLQEAKFRHPYALRHADLNLGVETPDASVVLLVLTLQFVRPLNRERIVQRIYEGLQPNGCLILVEKVLCEDSLLNRLFIKHYYEFKRRNGYSELEIAQKREALENVLVPYRLRENEELLRARGFRQLDVFFKWYNFCGLVAVK